jgi:cell division protein FtsW
MIKKLYKKIFKKSHGEHEPDKSLITAIFILLVFGLVVLFSASSVVSYARYGNTYYYFAHQLMGLGVGLLAFFVASKIDYRVWKKFAIFFLFFSIFLLILVFIPGIRADHGTARSWINVFGYSFQPSELVKLSFLIYLATWLEAKKGELNNLASGIMPFLIILGVISGLMILQPDLGTYLLLPLLPCLYFLLEEGNYHT